MALSNPSSGTGYLYANPIISGLGCNSNYTMMAWARTSFPANSVMDIFGFVSGTGDYILTHFERSGSTRKIVCYNSSSGADGSTGLSADTWYHVAMVNAGGGSNSAPVVYLNGASDITTSTVFPPNVTQMIIAGQPDYTEPLAGYVVAFKAWNTNLSAAEIAIEMNSWTAVRKANLIAEFPFGDIDALRLNNRVSAGNDLSEANTSVTFGDPGHPGIAWGFSNLPIIGVPSAGGGSITKILGSTVNVSDGFVRARNRDRILGSTVNVSDGFVRARSRVFALNATLNLIADLVRARTMIRAYAATSNISETQLNARNRLQIWGSTLNISSDFLKALGKVKIFGSTINISSGFIKALGKIKILGATINVSGAFEKTRARIKAFSATLNISDGLVRARSLIRALSSTIDISSGLSRARSMIRAFGATINISDALFSILTGTGLVKVLNATINVSEGIFNVFKLYKIWGASLNLSETIVRPRTMIRALGSTLNVSDSILRARALIRQFTSTINISDSFERLRTRIKAFASTINISSTLLKARGFVKVFNETLNISSGFVKVLNLITFNDTLTKVWKAKSRAVTWTAKTFNRIWKA